MLVNYETTWYPSNHAAYALAKDEKALGEIRKVVVHDGHRGPEGDRRPARVPRLAHRPGEERRRGPVRLRLLRRQPDDLAHGRRAARLRDRRDPAVQARDLSRRSTTRRRSSWSIPGRRRSSRRRGTGRSTARTWRSTAGPAQVLTVGPGRPAASASQGSRRSIRQAPPLSPPEDDFLRYFAAVVRGEIGRPRGLSSLREQPGRHRDPRRRPPVGRDRGDGAALLIGRVADPPVSHSLAQG